MGCAGAEWTWRKVCIVRVSLTSAIDNLRKSLRKTFAVLRIENST